MSKPPLSNREVAVIRHALGFNGTREGKVSHRNYFLAEDGGEDFQTWKGLEDRGLAVSWKTSLADGATYFAVGIPAALAVRKTDEHLGRDEAAAMRHIDAKLSERGKG